jgi:Ca2+-binding RTX toxin-like protein
MSAFNLSKTTQNLTDANGNQIRQVGSYTLTNGATRAMDDVWYSVNTAETVDVATPVTVSATIAALPNLTGAGNVHNLQQAMARDASGKLTALTQTFASAANTMTLAQARSAAEAILLDWTGADRYSATSRGTNIDGREVYALEAFMGQGFTQSSGTNAGTNQPGPNTAALLQQAYGKLLDWTTAQLLAQTKFAPWINQTVLSWDAATQSMGVDVSKLVSTLKGLYTSNATDGAAWMNEFARSLKGMGDTGAMILSALHQQGSVSGTGFSLALATMGYTAVIGNAKTVTLNGVANQDSMLVGVSGETLIAGNGDDLLVAGGGGEKFNAGSGNDTFVFNKSSGQLSIYDASVAKVASVNQDVLRLGAGLTPASTTIARNVANDLILGFGNGDQVTIAGYFNYGSSDPSIVFADGTTWHAADLISRVPLLGTNASYQVLYGATDLDDTIIGGVSSTIYAGNRTDTITFGRGDNAYAGAGVDTFIFNKGSGAVTLHDANLNVPKSAGSNQDVLKLGAGITAAGTQLTRSLANDLIINAGNGDTLTLASYFNQTGNLPTVVFADGTTWNLATLSGRLPLQDTTSGGHTLYGATGINDTIIGAPGDTLYAGNLNDTLTAGRGDTLYSGAGIDTFVYGKGSGAVTINDSYVTKTAGSNQDVVKLGAGITAAGTQITRDIPGNLVLVFGNGDQVTIKGYFDNGSNAPTITFADGTAWNFSTVTSKLVFTDTSAGGNTLYGLRGMNNTIVGAPNDTIYAGDMNDTLTAGKNGTLNSGAGVDTFIYNKGSGSVTITDTTVFKAARTNQDVVKLGAGLTAAGTQLTRNLWNDLILSFGNGDQVTLSDYFRNTTNDPTIVFADGTRWDVPAVASRLVFQDTTAGGNTLRGANGINNTIIGAANDTLNAGNLNDTITAGKNNTLNAGAGTDTFLYNKGCGAVVLNEGWSKTAGKNQDVVKLGAGITAATTQITRDLSNNLVLSFGNGDQLQVSGYFGNALEQPSIVFADGTSWNFNTIANQLVFTDTSAGNNWLYGLTGVNNRIVGAVNDTIQAGNLNDTITAGKNDTLYGGAGVDTFIFNRGAGAVTLTDTYVVKTAGKNQDVLRLGASITPAATTMSRDLSGNLCLSFGNGDQVTLSGYFKNAINDPTIVFQDGTTWNYASITNQLVFTDTSAGGNFLVGLNGVNNRIVGAPNDTIIAGNLNDTVTAGKNDTLDAGMGVDTFKINAGSGTISINESIKTGGANQDVLQFTGAKSNQLWFRAVGNNLEIDVLGTSDYVTINNWMSNASTHVQQIQTTDAVMSPADRSVGLLVQAMASFGAPPAVQTAYTPTEQAAFAPLLASSWRHTS